MPRTSSLPSTFSIQLAGERGSLLVSRPGPAVVSIRVAGHSVEDLVDTLSQELETDLVIQGPLTLLVDNRARGAEILGSPRWALWFRNHREHIVRVVVLVAPSFVKSTGELARTFGGLDDKLVVVLEPSVFERWRVEALRSPAVSGTWDLVDVDARPPADG